MVNTLQLITFNYRLMQVIFINDLLMKYVVHSRFTLKQPFTFSGSGQSNESNVITEDPFVGRNDSNLFWMEALRDIAYYLRGHKFTEYDRRYKKDYSKAPKEYYAFFPRPPLRSLHWEVNKYCEQSFITCVEYLHTRIKKTDLRRSDDTAIVMLQQNWTVAKNNVQIQAIEKECKKMRDNSEKFVNPFEGPLERFQWRTTASYFMCWFTMNEVADLMHLNESCDNFASCLDVNMRPHNNDIRAIDSTPFLCAMYSFCPDPCCPRQHLKDQSSCLDITENPCFETNPSGQRECVVKRQENRDFRDIILNRWNVTCRCPWKGFVWDSRYGMCVDIDECLTGIHECDPLGEACINLKGTYECVCRWGYYRTDKKCKPSAALTELKLNRKTNMTEDRIAESIVKQLYRVMFHRSSSSMININFYFLTPYVLFLIVP